MADDYQGIMVGDDEDLLGINRPLPLTHPDLPPTGPGSASTPAQAEQQYAGVVPPPDIRPEEGQYPAVMPMMGAPAAASNDPAASAAHWRGNPAVFDPNAAANAAPVPPKPAPGSADYYQAIMGQHDAAAANPWGSPTNHPGFGGKFGHVMGKIAGYALDAADPGLGAAIPQTPLGRAVQQKRDELNLETARASEADTAQKQAQAAESTARAGALTNPKMASITVIGPDGQPMQMQVPLAAVGQDIRAMIAAHAAEADTSANVAGRQGVADTNVAGRETVATQNNQTKEDIEKSREANARELEATRGSIAVEVENIRAAAGNDPDKLTATMKTMKQQAQATLPEIDKALDETERIANKLGPAEGRWNDFWQGKIGADDPDYAHYKDEIGFVSTAVTLAHARGRMSNELFEHFQNMFDAGKQSPENMIQALNVAHEWLDSYAKMGDQPAGGGQAPAGAVGTMKGSDGKNHYVDANHKDLGPAE